MLAIYASEKALRPAESLTRRARQPRARDLRPRLRPHRRLREGTRESRALGRAGARSTTARRCVLCSRWATTWRSPRPTTTKRPRPTTRRWSSPSEVGDLPSQVELHAALAPARGQPRGLGGGRGADRGSASLAEREGLHGKLCFPYVMRGALPGAKGDDARHTPARTSWATRSAAPRSPSALYWLAAAAARLGGLSGRNRAGAGPRCLRARRPDRAVDRGYLGPRRGSPRSAGAWSRPRPRLRRRTARRPPPLPVGHAAKAEASAACAEDLAAVD